MANLAALYTAPTGQNQIGLVWPTENGTAVYPFLAAAAINAGQAVYVNSTGTVDLCDTATAGKEQFRGIALESVGAGQVVDVVQYGVIDGFDLSAVAFDAIIYGSDTPGSIGTTAGTKSVPIGRVRPMSVKDSAGAIKKVLMVSTTYLSNY